MPRVPQYERQVQERGLPSARLTQAADTEAFGGGQSFQQVTNAAAKFIQEKKQEADDIATTEAYSDAVKAKNELMYDPQNGAMNRKGKNAIGAVEEYSDQYQKRLKDIEKKLRNGNQRAMFEKIKSRESLELHNTLQRHEFQEHARYDQETTMSAIEASRDDAIKNYQNNGKVSESISIQVAAIDAHGKRNGLSSEAIKSEKEKAVSSTHSGVINRMLNNGQDKLAKAYFDEVKTSLTGDDTARIEKSLSSGTLRGEAQRKTDEIIGKAESLKDGLEMARSIKDSNLRDEVVSRVKTRFSESKAISDQQKEKRYQQAADILEKTGDKDRIPNDLWSQLSLSERNAIDSRAKQIASGIPVSTDWKVYYELKTQASSSDTRDKFLRTNLLTVRDKLSDSDFKELVKLQSQLRTGDQKALEEVSGYRTANQVVNDTMKSVGIDPNKDEEKASLLKRRVDQEISDLAKRTGKKPNTQEIQGIVDNLLVRGEVDGFFYNPNKFLFEVEKGDVFMVDTKDIPRNERLKIEEALRANNLPITEDSVIDLYNRKLQRNLGNAN